MKLFLLLKIRGTRGNGQMGGGGMRIQKSLHIIRGEGRRKHLKTWKELERLTSVSY